MPEHPIRFVLFALAPIAIGCSSVDSHVASPHEPTAGSTAQTDGGTDDGAPAAVGEASCSGTTGTFHSSTLDVAGDQRFYFLHVPATYTCGDAWPLVVDFHGTCTDDAGPPEECWNNDEYVALADRAGFILARPRSRSAVFDQLNYYQWDINAGELEKNVAFAKALVSSIAQRYHVDPARRYATGYSSGTNMAAQFLSKDNPLFGGFAFVSGGVWTVPDIAPFGNDAARVYAVDGYHDYFFPQLRNLENVLSAHGYPASRFFFRETGSGHHQAGWHLREAWDWMDKGERPPEGVLAAPWTRDTTFASSESLLRVVKNRNGDLIVSGADGSVFRKDAATSAWSTVATLGDSFRPHLTSLCLDSGGHGIAVGEGFVGKTTNDGLSWSSATPVPSFGGPSDPAYVVGGACLGADKYFAAGDLAEPTQAVTVDMGASWTENASPDFRGSSGFAVAPTGTILGVSVAGLGRSIGGAFSPIASVAGLVDAYWNDATAGAGGNFWVVGNDGRIAHSSDDGVTWTNQSIADGTGKDLFAVSFADAMTGLAVGAHGLALVTRDGGASWTEVPTGLDSMLAHVMFVAPRRAVVVGGQGTVLSIDL